MIGSALGFVGAGFVGAAQLTGLFDAAAVLGLDDGSSESAAARQPATRLAFDGKLTFPVDVTGGDLVMPNGFGGASGVRGEGGHNGVDIGNGCTDGRGRPLLACIDGVVHSQSQLQSAGNTLVLRDGVGNYYRYHHLDEYESSIAVGDEVTAGDVIGYMGSTGNTQWAHLHFEVWVGGISPGQGGAAVDPEPRLPLPIEGVTVGQPDC